MNPVDEVINEFIYWCQLHRYLLSIEDVIKFMKDWYPNVSAEVRDQVIQRIEKIVMKDVD